ncbi:hypothetical protein [Gloeothece verrucosa]|uniref:Uncharacterized protein n=1 Tax=Gloeothece verrucosa (strain PCC 7822) TaxID=497965 RepID=E0UMW7_GLOV7|nr:hypothetical protein [Gloeothece verrucosa]ADN18297.1 hypothetical protein Cyan7822_6528 [Gloeothece verrucosa PCC 7822]
MLERHWATPKEAQEAEQPQTSLSPQNANPTSEDDISLNLTSPPVIAGAEVDKSPTNPQTPGVDKTKPDIPITTTSVENASNNERISRLEEIFIQSQTSIHQLSKDIASFINILPSLLQRPDQTPLPPTTPLLGSPSQPNNPTPVQQESTASPSRRTTEETPQNATEEESSAQPATPKNAASLEKINKAIDLIIDLNNSATTKKDKWLVSLSALKQLTKCGQDTIARVLQQRASEIENHHALHELGKFHNNKGKFAPPITEVIQLAPPIK